MKNKLLSTAAENAMRSTRLTAHEMECRRMFSEVENGAQLYIRVDQPASTENTQYVRISLLSDRALQYDAEMFSAEGRTDLLEKYRPYFISFVVPLEDNCLSDIIDLGQGWHRGNFIKSNDAGENEKGTCSLLTGILVTSASPVNYIEKRLLVFKRPDVPLDILDKINQAYDLQKFKVISNADVEATLQDAWGVDVPEKIDIYNVGHGNADYIRGAHQRILYDVGYNYRCIPGQKVGKYQKAAVAIRHLKPNCVILSHWDLDHIIGCAYAKQDIFNVKWVAPHLISRRKEKPSPNAVRLANYLNFLGNLCLVDRDQRPQLIATIPCTNDVEMKMWLGGGPSILTPKNREGLFIEIADKCGSSLRRYPHVLLAGDVPYQCMEPSILQSPVDFMHVPHHCSNMETDGLDSMPGGRICAVISTNRKKDGLPNYDKAHHEKLEKKFADVVTTIEHPSGDDSANLAIEILYNTSGGAWRLR